MMLDYATLREEGEKLVLNHTNDPKARGAGARLGAGCVTVFAGFFFALFALGGLGYMILSLSNDTELDLFGLFGASLFFIAGLAGVMALVNNLKRRQYHVEITFDSIAQQMCYSQEGANGVYEVGYGLFDHLEVEKEVKTSSNSGSSTSSRTTYYHIYLILKSNTRFWLFTVVNSKKKAREKVGIVQSKYTRVSRRQK